MVVAQFVTSYLASIVLGILLCLLLIAYEYV